MESTAADKIFETSGTTDVVRFEPREILTTAAQIARYAGGTRYKPDERMDPIIHEALDLAGRLIEPRGAYIIVPVTATESDTKLTLAGGVQLSVPPAGLPAPTAYIMGVVATLGLEIGNNINSLSDQGDFLKALYLNAASAGSLEVLDIKLFKLLQDRLRTRDLFVGCRLGPGLNEAPMELQSQLFDLLDTGRIGVELNQYLLMKPGQSISYFTRLTQTAVKAMDEYKCRNCNMSKCNFRIGPAVPDA
jgi:hypothetical protein